MLSVLAWINLGNVSEKIIIMYFFFFVKAKQIFKMVTALVFIRKIYWVFGKWVSLEFCNVANFTPVFSICIYLLLFFIPTLLITIRFFDF